MGRQIIIVVKYFIFKRRRFKAKSKNDGNERRQETEGMNCRGISLAVQWLDSMLPVQVALVRSLVRKLRSHVLCYSQKRRRIVGV